MEKNKNLKQFFLFVLFSLGAGIIEFISYSLLCLVNKDISFIKYAEITSVVLSCIFNFTVNRKYTFKNSSNIYIGMMLYGLFYLITAPLWAWGMTSLVSLVGEEYNLVIKISKMLINFVFDFLYCKFVIFGWANKMKLKSKEKSSL